MAAVLYIIERFVVLSPAMLQPERQNSKAANRGQTAVFFISFRSFLKIFCNPTLFPTPNRPIPHRRGGDKREKHSYNCHEVSVQGVPFERRLQKWTRILFSISYRYIQIKKRPFGGFARRSIQHDWNCICSPENKLVI